ncbi:MAG: hypothetical protein PHG00_18120 [Methylococcales bacterium]|nr:hypothetical protein [Methylococcales bacterium]
MVCLPIIPELHAGRGLQPRPERFEVADTYKKPADGLTDPVRLWNILKYSGLSSLLDISDWIKIALRVVDSLLQILHFLHSQ